MQLASLKDGADYIIAPDPSAPRLTRALNGVDHNGALSRLSVVEERPLTIFLNSQEIVTAMTIGDYPEYLALGFLRNQGMLHYDDTITGVDFDEELETVVVRTKNQTSYEDKLKKRTRTSGCAVGTVFGDMMEGLENVRLPQVTVRTSWLYELAARINRTPSLYLEAGAIHGTVLCRENRPLVYMEDVGRHNAVDKIAGWMLKHNEPAGDKIMYTTGRLTSEMVIKTAMMGIPVLASRSGFTAWGVEIAREVGLTLIGRMRGQRFVCLSRDDRLIRDVNPASVSHEDGKHRRKSARPRDERISTIISKKIRDFLVVQNADKSPMKQPLGVILAGGRATRMGGGDKGLLALGDRTLLAHVIDRLGPQVAGMALNANGDAARFSGFGLPVLPDTIEGFAGPLAGVLAGLDWAAGQGADAIVTAAADTPFFPCDLVAQLLRAGEGMDVPLVLAATPDTRTGLIRHPTFGLWPVSLRDDLRAALRGGLRKVRLWSDAHGGREAVFPVDGIDPFFNVNTPGDLLRAQKVLEGAA